MTLTHPSDGEAMQTMPLDPTRLGTLLGLGVEPDVDDKGVQKTDRDGQPAWKVEVLHRPAQTGDFTPKAGVELVKIVGRQPVVTEMAPITFVGLVARLWEMNGKKGVSLSAEGIAPVKPVEK